MSGLSEARQPFVHDAPPLAAPVSAPVSASASPEPRADRHAERHADRHKVKVGPGGRLVIPAAVRDALGIAEGDTLVLACEEGSLRVMTMDQALERARALMRKAIPADAKLVDELIAERRAEALGE